MNPHLNHHVGHARTAELLRQPQRRGSVTVTRPRLRLRAAIRRAARRLSKPANWRPRPEAAPHSHGWSAFRRRVALWAVAFAFLVLLAFSTAPSPLYVLYAHRDDFSALVITLIYAAYALGVVGSLFLVSHLSDLHGRRPHLLLAIAIAVVSGALFIAWPSLPGLFVARILSGISVGLTVSTATAYLDELHRAQRPQSSVRRPQLLASVANLGGLSLGALVAGLLAQYATHPLVLPYVALLGMLVIAGIALALSPATRHPKGPLPRYRPQKVSAPKDARPQFLAALIGVFLAYSGPAVFIGLAGTFLVTAVHDRSVAMTGVTIFVVFAVGVALIAVTRSWPVRRLLITGVALDVVGLALVVVAAWLPAPSLVLFLAGGGVVGGGAAALFKGTLGSIVAISPPDKLGETLAGFFLFGYVGLSLPAIAVGIALQAVSARDTLLAFAIAVSAGILAASRVLLNIRQPDLAEAEAAV